jgi:protein gp37
MCDVFDKNAPDGQRERLWQLIRDTPMLDWQLLTKRAPNIEKCLPDDWGDGYSNVWLGVTVEDKKHGLRRAEVLRSIPAKIRFLSIEPLLECLGLYYYGAFDWVIVGGESGHHARPMEESWVWSIKGQCEDDGTPFFFKQWGGRKDKGGCLMNGAEFKQWPTAG